MVVVEKLMEVRKELESGKPMLALPPSPIRTIEVTDPKSPEFKEAMRIYERTFPEEEREENYKIARYISNTQKLGHAKKGSNSEFHLLLIKDTSRPEGKQVIGQAQISYVPGKRWGALWYVSVDPSKRASWRRVVEGLNGFKREVEGYAKKHGEKPIGLFMDVKDTKKNMEGIVARDGYFFNDINFETPAVNEGGKPDPTKFGFVPYQNVDLPRWAIGDVIADYFKAGFKVGDPKKTPQYKKAMDSAKEDIYRFAKKR